jgi:hypothetical protein
MRAKLMSNSYSYTTELEQLIINTLLPVYEKYYKEHNISDAYSGIDPELLRQIKRKKVVAALLRPKEK